VRYAGALALSADLRKHLGFEYAHSTRTPTASGLRRYTAAHVRNPGDQR
jgi:hypothetical protein